MRHFLGAIVAAGFVAFAGVARAADPAISIDKVIAGTNFESVVASGSVDLGGKSGTSQVCLVAVAGDGLAVTQKFAYAGGGSYAHAITGLKASAQYVISAYLEIDAAVCATSGEQSAITARPVDWVNENVYTFAGTQKGTGDWKANNVAKADTSANVIRFVGEDWENHATFGPTNDSMSIRMSHMKELRFNTSFDRPGFALDAESKPEIPEDFPVAVTLVVPTEQDGTCSFAIASNGVWCVIDRAVMPAEKGKTYDITVLFDYDTKTAAYDIVNGDKIVRLAVVPFALPGENDKSSLEFAGSGAISQITGTCEDAHLMQVGYTEYWTLDEAREAAGETKMIVPLWTSQYSPSDAEGLFRITDPESYLDVSFAKWYHYSVTLDSPLTSTRSYRYVAGNNWIEYSDEAGVKAVSDGWLVTSEAGLAWIAEQATNAWFGGKVYLDADLDLSSKNWTPIARFTGLFDGANHTISGLNNTNVLERELLGEAGHYFGAPTNDWGYSAYGLFGCATNATFRNVKLADVAISNTADSVAALLGVHAGGDLSIANVTADSGYVLGEGRAVAGLATIGGNGGKVGDVTVSKNTNRAKIVGTLFNDEDGGNVAQILAGTTWGTTFGTVVATNNVGAGTFDVAVLEDAFESMWDDSSFNWLTLPVCNLAPAVICTDAKTNFWSFVEANQFGSVPVDPVKRTARMAAGWFVTGDANIMGEWQDAISALGNGETLTIEGTGATLDGWETVDVDRDVTIDLNKNCIYGIYDCDVFKIESGKTLTLQNGTIYYAHGYLPTNGKAVLTNVSTAEIPGADFYARTVPISGLDVASGYVTINVPYTSTDFVYIVDSTPTLAQDWQEGVASELGTGGSLDIQVPAAGASGFYRVRINPAP